MGGWTRSGATPDRPASNAAGDQRAHPGSADPQLARRPLAVPERPGTRWIVTGEGSAIRRRAPCGRSWCARQASPWASGSGDRVGAMTLRRGSSRPRWRERTTRTRGRTVRLPLARRSPARDADGSPRVRRPAPPTRAAGRVRSPRWLLLNRFENVGAASRASRRLAAARGSREGRATEPAGPRPRRVRGDPHRQDHVVGLEEVDPLRAEAGGRPDRPEQPTRAARSRSPPRARAGRIGRVRAGPAGTSSVPPTVGRSCSTTRSRRHRPSPRSRRPGCSTTSVAQRAPPSLSRVSSTRSKTRPSCSTRRPGEDSRGDPGSGSLMNCFRVRAPADEALAAVTPARPMRWARGSSSRLGRAPTVEAGCLARELVGPALEHRQEREDRVAHVPCPLSMHVKEGRGLLLELRSSFRTACPGAPSAPASA